MATLPPVPNVYKIEMQYLFAGETAENVFHYSVFGTSAPPTVDEVAAQCKSWFNTTGKGQMTNQVALQRIVVTDLTSSSAPRSEYVSGLPILGSSPSNAVPNNVAPIVNWSIIERYRGGQPRTMHIGWPEDWVTNNTLDSTRRDALIAAYGLLRTGLEGLESGSLMGMVSYYHNKVLRSEPVFYAFLDCTVNPTIGSMRTRLPFHRRRHKKP